MYPVWNVTYVPERPEPPLEPALEPPAFLTYNDILSQQAAEIGHLVPAEPHPITRDYRSRDVLPQQLEYLFVLALLAAAGLTLLWGSLRLLLRRKSFWTTIAVVTPVFVLIDLLAIRWGWWSFNPDRVCGIRVFTLPLEEHLLFVLFLTLTLGVWESLSRAMD